MRKPPPSEVPDIWARFHYDSFPPPMASDPLQLALQQAVQLHQSGRLGEAEPIYRSVLAKLPNQPDALHLLGVLLSQTGRSAEALGVLRRAAAVAPQSPDILSNLAIALAQSGETAPAIESLRSALRLRPDHRDAKANLANLLIEHGEHLRQNGKFAEAQVAIEEAVQLAPDRPDYLNQLGVTYASLGQKQKAAHAFEKAIALKPDYADPHNNLGLCLEGERAIAEFETAIRLKPSFPGAYNNLGNALRESDKLKQAINAFRTAIELKPDYAQAIVGLAGALEARGDLEEAISLYRRALENHSEAPDIVENSLGTALKNFGQVPEAVQAFRRAIELNPNNPGASSNLAFTLWYDPRATAEEILEEHRRWNERHARPLRASIKPPRNSPDPDRRIKLGYVSPDFRQHATAFCLVPLLSHHDHSAFDIYCYSSVKKPDAVTDRLRPCADHWIDCFALSDEELAERIRSDGIDLLVDLSMHTADNRLLLFARKPAPVQAAWVASPCTTGLETIDYRLTDPYLDPPGQTDALYSEKSIRLPDSFWCYNPLTDLPEVGPLPATQNHHVTFGCLNNVCKLNDGVFALWSKIIQAVPDSHLIVRLPAGSPRRWATEQLNIDPRRIRFVDRQPRFEYLETYNQIDIMLDTIPYNGHMTSLDSLWMGVPVITLVGKTVVGRAGLSQLTNLGQPELIARDESQFVQIAAGVAGDLPRLAALRGSLRKKMEKSPLMDGGRFARNVEEAYRRMWRDWCAGRP
jgi:protein O-GlcNAc transferase